MDTVNWYSDSIGNSLLQSSFPNYCNYCFHVSGLTKTEVYYAEAKYNGCKSLTRKPAVASIIMPPVLTPKDGFHCGPGQVAIGALTTTGTTTPYLTSSATFYALANKCARVTIPVKATIDTLPIITSIKDSSRCGPGWLTLYASAENGAINWYADSTGGTSISRGNSFTTPDLKSTTVYYVDATNNKCTSTNRAAVIATIINSDSCQTSITDISSSYILRIYPNPTSGEIEISVSEGLPGDCKIDLFNSLGVLMLTSVKPNKEKLYQLDLSDYPKGMYFVQVKTQHRSYQSKIIKL